MAKWLPDSTLDLILDDIATATEQAVCSQQPTTVFQAIWPTQWVASTSYSVGDCVRPPTQNGCVYECITAGTSGATEPGWGTTQDQEFSDGGVTWRTHLNYSLANVAVGTADFSKTDDTNGRKLSVAQKDNVVVHTTGTVSHTALLTATELKFVTTAQTTDAADNDVEEGKTTIMYGYTISVTDPQ